MTRKATFSIIFAAFAFLSLQAEASAQLFDREWRLSGNGGYAILGSIGELDGVDVSLTSVPSTGASLALFVGDRWGVRANWFFAPSDLEVGNVEVGGVNVYGLDGAFLYRFSTGRVQPYGLVGLGVIVYDPDRDVAFNVRLGSGETHTAVAPAFGAGLAWSLSRTFELGIEVTDHVTFESIDPATFIDGTFDDKAVNHVRLVVGLSVTTGR